MPPPVPAYGKKPFKDLAGASSICDQWRQDCDLCLMASLFEIKLADAEAVELVKKIRFSGGESPNTLELRKDGYLLLSDQNMMMYDFSGKQVFHAFHKAPGSSLLAKVASTAAIVAVNAASAGQCLFASSIDGNESIVYFDHRQSNHVEAVQSNGSGWWICHCTHFGGKQAKTKVPGLVKVAKERWKRCEVCHPRNEGTEVRIRRCRRASVLPFRR